MPNMRALAKPLYLPVHASGLARLATCQPVNLSTAASPELVYRATTVHALRTKGSAMRVLSKLYMLEGSAAWPGAYSGNPL